VVFFAKNLSEVLSFSLKGSRDVKRDRSVLDQALVGSKNLIGKTRMFSGLRKIREKRNRISGQKSREFYTDRPFYSNRSLFFEF